MAEEITWGILGAGYISRVAMTPALASLPETRLLAIAGRDEQRVTTLADAYNVPRIYTDYQSLLDDPDIQCVYIALANNQHREWVERAAAAGKHILCEKPMGRTAAETAAMRAAADRHGVALMEALMYRFHPRIEQALTLIAHGAIGEPREVEAAFCFTLGDLSNYRMRPEAGGGALLDLGCYCVTAAQFFLGGEPLSVRASARYAETGVDLAVSALLDFKGGGVARISCAFDSAEYQRVTVIGTSASLELPYAFTAWRDDPAPILIHRGKSVETTITPSANPYARMANAFGRAAVSGKAAPHSLDETMAVAHALDAIAIAARTGDRVAVAV